MWLGVGALKADRCDLVLYNILGENYATFLTTVARGVVWGNSLSFR